MKILDTRDLQTRLEELEAIEKLDDITKNNFNNSDQGKELADLRYMAEEIPEWSDAARLIPVDSWMKYVQEQCEELGDIPKDLPSYIAIDWEVTAENSVKLMSQRLKMTI